MSGLAGVFYPNGGAMDRIAFARVLGCIAYRGPDGVRSWHGPGTAIAFARFVRTPDAVFDRQPLFDAASETCVTFDGRLDNREELAEQLGIRLTGETCDVALAAAAYRRWGNECPVRLIGDFSLAVWNGRECEVLLARDIMGFRPLFYRQLDGAWWWASDQRALIELDIPAINEGFVGEHLCGQVTSIDETLYEGIHRLPMAHSLVLGRTTRRWRYWRPDPEARLSYRDARDYDEHYRTLLKEAVRARLRLHGPSALLLSGGIDSSSVAVQIAELRDEGHSAATRVNTLSMTIPGSPACEEPVIRAVLERVRLPHALIPAEDPPADYFSRDAAVSLDLPQPPSSSLGWRMREAAFASGRTVVFTGYGGDDWFDTSYAALGEELRRGRVITAARRLTAMARVRNQTATSQIVRIGAWMALPQGVRKSVRGVLRRDPVPTWIDPRFARTYALADRLRRRPDEVPFTSLVQYDLFRGATCGAAGMAADQEERYNAAVGLEQRHPLMDRRLIEFGLALPPEERCSGGVSKALMRRAMVQKLPAAVTIDPPNDDFGFLGLRALSHLGGVTRLLQSRPVERGWLRAEAALDLYRGLEGGVTRCLWPLCTATGVDFWLGALEGAVATPMEDHGSYSLHLAT